MKKKLLILMIVILGTSFFSGCKKVSNINHDKIFSSNEINKNCSEDKEIKKKNSDSKKISYKINSKSEEKKDDFDTTEKKDDYENAEIKTEERKNDVTYSDKEKGEIKPLDKEDKVEIQTESEIETESEIQIDRNLSKHSKEEALKLVSEFGNYKLEQLSSAEMDYNVYLINTFKTVDMNEIDNLYLVVNGKIIDRRYLEKNIESKTFAENFERFRTNDPLINQIRNTILDKQLKKDISINGDIALLINKKTGFDIANMQIEKINEEVFLVECYSDGDKNKLRNKFLVINGLIQEQLYYNNGEVSDNFETSLKEYKKQNI